MIKAIVLTITGLFFCLFVLTMFVPYPPALEQARAARFSEEEINVGLQITFERRLFLWASVALELSLLFAFALTSLGRRLANHLLAWTGERRVLAALGIVLTFGILHEVLYLPIGIGRFYHAHAWGLANLTLPEWLRDHLLYFCINLVLQAIMVVGLYALLIWLPRFWWLVAPLGGAALAIAYAFLAPILINPLFNDFTPLSESKWRAKQPLVKALIDRAEVPVQDILVMNGSRQSNHTNAYFTGLGPTRRIVLFDTLLEKHTDDEIESVLAHELGHWRHDHIVKGILLGMLAALVGCFALHRCLRLAIGRAPWHLHSVADPAGIPLVMLLVFLGSWIAMPVGNLISRHFERQADQTSLELADVPRAFIAAERKMARTNKANVAPPPWNVWLFSTHPTVVERIQAAQDWQAR